MNQRVFYNVSYSFIFRKKERNDSLQLESLLKQNSLALKCGYNLVAKEWMVISPYGGLRSFRFKHLTRSQDDWVSIDDYYNHPNIDLRLTQVAAISGVNFSFSYAKRISFGFFLEYSQNLGQRPVLRAKGTGITNKMNSPVNHFLLGMGMGLH